MSRSSVYSQTHNDGEEDEDGYEEEGLTTGEPVSFMCLPCSITASCVSSTNHTTASLTFSKVVLTAEETRVYQIPWEKQQKKIHKNNRRSLCFCWCCVCTCLCKPVNNRLARRVSMSNHDLKRRTACYKSLVEQKKPSVEQIEKWSVNFEELLHNELGRKLFYLFLQQEHSEENLQFWNEVNGMKEVEDCKEKIIKMRSIYKEFIKPMALKEVNIAGNTRRQIEQMMETKPNEQMFDSAQNQVFLMMHRQSYPRFLQSEMFHAVLQTTYAYNPNSPKPPLPSNSNRNSFTSLSSSTNTNTADNTVKQSTGKEVKSPDAHASNPKKQPQANTQEQPIKHNSQSHLSDEASTKKGIRGKTTNDRPNTPSSTYPKQQVSVKAEPAAIIVPGNQGKQLDRHNSMPTSQKTPSELHKLKMENKLAARNSTNI